MSYSEYDEIDESFKISGVDEDEPLDPLDEIPAEVADPDLDEDPYENRYR